MTDRSRLISERLNDTLDGCETPAPDYRGKVRDVYECERELLIVTTDRVSAFDVVLGAIPLKGALLTEQATHWLKRAETVMRTHFIERVDPQMMRTHRAEALPVELVVRGHLAGSLMREPADTRGHAYGVNIAADVADYAPFDVPLITPTTKAPKGEHDEAISRAEIVSRGLVPAKIYDEACAAALALFALGVDEANKKGLILVDTKYEMGILDGKLILIDEIHTADSSRYWRADTYDARRAANEAPDMLDKERLRRWLLAQGFSGTGPPPGLSDEIRVDLASHYWDLTEMVVGHAVAAPPIGVDARVQEAVTRTLKAMRQT